MSNDLSQERSNEVDPVQDQQRCVTPMSETPRHSAQEAEEELPSKPWHCAEHRSIRGGIVEATVDLLTARFPFKTESSIRGIAERFESHVYHKADSVGQYADRSTLKRRLFEYALSKRKGSAPCPCCSGETSGMVAGAVVCAAGDACRGAGRDPVALRREQQHLILLLRHSSKCSAPPGSCALRNCAAVKEQWAHLSACKDNSCSATNCVSIRGVLNHYTMCKERECVLCAPVREVIRRSLVTEQTRAQTGCPDAPPCPLRGGVATYTPRKIQSALARRAYCHLLPACVTTVTGTKRQRDDSSRVDFPNKRRRAESGVCHLPPFLCSLRRLAERAAMKGYIFGELIGDISEDDDYEDEEE